MLTDKLTVTHHLLEELSRVAGKAAFMPADQIGKALQYLETHGLPNNKLEEYKYCNVEGIIRKEFKALDGVELTVDEIALRGNYYVDGASNVYVVNGRLAASCSDLPENVHILPIEAAPKEILRAHLGAYVKADSSAMAALNTAYADRGIFIAVNKNAAIEQTIVIHHIFRSRDNFFFNTRNLIVAEVASSVKITEVFYPAIGKNFCNSLTEIFTAENAHVHHTRVQNCGNTCFSVDTSHAQLNSNSNYSNNVFTFSGSLVRNNLSVALNAENAECHLYGLALTKKQQIVDNHTLVDHQKPHCESNELYKGIADDKSTLTFNGQIFVERDAQKTNAYQSSKNILLSDDATVNAKPELEIYANDVKCSHGTSTGKVDENALFYLKSRGIGEVSARKLLLHAFAHEVINKVSDRNTALFIENLFDHNLN